MAERPTRTPRWTVVVAVTALTLAACGDDDGDDDGEQDGTVVDETDPAAADTTAPVDTTAPAADEDPVVAIVGVAEGFAPPTVTVAAGTEVTWRNVDVLTHTATADDGSWDSGNLAVNESFSFVAGEPGTYPYFCTIHPSMVGELVVE